MSAFYNYLETDRYPSKEKSDSANNKDALLWDLSDEEKQQLFETFTLLDKGGNGVIQVPELEFLLVSLGRLPFDDNLAQVLAYAGAKGCENSTGMDCKGFTNYIKSQLRNLNDINELRRAFEMFDTSPPTGTLNAKELRHNLKTVGITLTDDEIDFLFREEDYWMLDENYTIEYEKLISKLFNRPCDSQFLNSTE